MGETTLHAVQMKLRAKEIRKDRGLSLEDVAEAIEMTPATLSRIENNRQNTKLDVLDALANFYGIAVPELFEYDGANPLMRLAWAIPPDQATLAADLLEMFSRHVSRPQPNT